MGGGEGGDEGGAPEAVGGGVGGGDDGYRSQAYSFDSTALERAAKAAKDLEKSPHATDALALSKEQEKTRQQEQLVKIKEYELGMEEMKTRAKQMEGE